MAKKTGDPAFRRRIARLVQLKAREIRDGCLYCQGLATKGDGTLGCAEHAELINDMVLHPRKYADRLFEPGEG